MRVDEMMELDPRPLFSERLAMGNMGPLHLRFHVWFRTVHHRIAVRLWPSADVAPSSLIRPWFWLWRQYRKTWTIRSRAGD